jgi:hypothetical protein
MVSNLAEPTLGITAIEDDHFNQQKINHVHPKLTNLALVDCLRLLRM